MKIKKTDETVMLAGLLWFAWQEVNVAGAELGKANAELGEACREDKSHRRIEALTKKVKGLTERQKSLVKARETAERNLRRASRAKSPVSAIINSADLPPNFFTLRPTHETPTVEVRDGTTVDFYIREDMLLRAQIKGNRVQLRGGIIGGGQIAVLPIAQNAIEVSP